MVGATWLVTRSTSATSVLATPELTGELRKRNTVAIPRLHYANAIFRYVTTLRRMRSEPRGARTAKCVQNANDQCVLQFTLLLAAGCVLHRRMSRAIHHRELWFKVFEGLNQSYMSW